MVTPAVHASQLRSQLVAWAEELQPAPFVEVIPTEPKVAPSTTGIVCAVIEGTGQVLPAASTLAGVSVEIITTIHLYRLVPDSDLSVDDDYETELTTARDTLLALLLQDLGLGALTLGSGAEWNVKGAHGGSPLSWGPGWLEDPNEASYRTQAIQLPAVVFNAWSVTR